MGLQLDHQYVFNPDGSGKVTVRWTGDSPSPDLPPEQFMGSEVSNGRGIDAWSDLSCTQEDGKLEFKATAHFKDIAELRFHCQGFHASTLDFVASTDEAGNFVLKTPAPPPGSSAPSTATDDELRGEIPKHREEIGKAREFIAGMVGGLVCTASLQLPGAIGKVRFGKKGKNNTVTLRFEGKALVDLMERLLTDDDLMLKLLRSGKQGPEALFFLMSDQGPLEAATTGALAPLFDYESEVGAAKETFAAFAEQVNLPKPPEMGPPLRNVRIVAAKIVREADSVRELHPMGQNYASLSLTVVGDLPDGVVKLEEGRMDAAIPDSGENLVPDDDWKRRISFPKMTNDRKTAFFDIEFPLPEPAVEGFKEIRGLLSVNTTSGAEEVDLGFKKLEAGAEGKELGAVIETLDPQEESTTLGIRLQVSKDLIESLALVGPKGEAAPMSERGYSSSGDQCQVEYSIEGAIPKKAKLIARVIRNLQRIDVPFELRNVDLLGRPRA
jgi:hypothetical protein